MFKDPSYFILNKFTREFIVETHSGMKLFTWKTGFLFIFIIHVGCKADEVYQKCDKSDCLEAGCATIYQHKDYTGWFQCQSIKDDDDCLEFNSWWKTGRVSSLDTHGTCVILHAEPKCRGASVKVEPSTKGSTNLKELNFNDVAQSISPCPSPSTRHVDKQHCPTGKYVKRIKIIDGVVRLNCYSPADVEPSVVIVGSQLTLERASVSSCDGPMRGVAVTTSRNKKLVVEGYCTYDLRREPANSLCDDSAQAVCGLQIEMVKRSSGRIQSYKGEPLCCRVKLPQCAASDRWDVIREYDNTAGTTDKEIDFQKSIGLGRSKSMTEAESKSADFYSNFLKSNSETTRHSFGLERGQTSNAGVNVKGVEAGKSTSLTGSYNYNSEVSKTFQHTMGQSNNTGLNWAKQSDATWNTQSVTTVRMLVPSGVKVRIEQPVGNCGSMEVRSDVVRRTDYDKYGHPFASPIHFKQRKRGCGIVDHKVGSVILPDVLLSPYLPTGFEIWTADTYNVTKVTHQNHSHALYLVESFVASSSILFLETTKEFPNFLDDQETTAIHRVLKLHCRDGTAVQYRFEFKIEIPGFFQQVEDDVGQ